MNNSTCLDVQDYLAHWDDYSIYTSVRVVFGILYLCVIVLSTISNTLIIYMISTTPSLRSVRNLFVAGLATNDIIVTLTSGIVTPLSIFQSEWKFGAFLCRASYLIQGMSFFISAYTLASIAVDRYILIVKAQQIQPITFKQAALILGSVWTMAVATSAIPVYRVRLIPLGQLCGKFCIENWQDPPWPQIRLFYGYASMFWQLVIPFSVTIFCYVMAGATIRRTIQFRRSRVPAPPVSRVTDMSRSQTANSYGSLIMVANGNQSDSTIKSTVQQVQRANNEAELRRMANTNKLLVAVVATFVTCWTPHFVFLFLKDLNLITVPRKLDNVLPLTVHFIAMLTVVSNPILYGMFNTNVRQATLNLMRKRFQACSRLRATAGPERGDNNNAQQPKPSNRMYITKNVKNKASRQALSPNIEKLKKLNEAVNEKLLCHDPDADTKL